MAVTPEMLLNRQINYLTLKISWVCFQGAKTQLELYNKLKISRQLYSRIMTGQCDTQLDVQSKRCMELTGLDSNFFKGKKAFELEGISYKEWEEFFGDTYERKSSKEYKDFAKRLQKAIESADKKLNTQRSVGLATSDSAKALKQLLYFARHGDKQTIENNYTLLNKVIDTLENIDILFLESVLGMEEQGDEFAVLERYEAVLKRQYELAHSVCVYRKNRK